MEPLDHQERGASDRPGPEKREGGARGPSCIRALSNTRAKTPSGVVKKPWGTGRLTLCISDTVKSGGSSAPVDRMSAESKMFPTETKREHKLPRVFASKIAMRCFSPETGHHYDKKIQLRGGVTVQLIGNALGGATSF